MNGDGEFGDASSTAEAPYGVGQWLVQSNGCIQTKMVDRLVDESAAQRSDVEPSPPGIGSYAESCTCRCFEPAWLRGEHWLCDLEFFRSV